MNHITLRQSFTGAGTGAPARVSGSQLQVQTTGMSVQVQATNLPDVEASWQTIGSASGLAPTAMSTTLGWIRCVAAGAGEVAISGALGATGGGGGGGGSTTDRELLTSLYSVIQAGTGYSVGDVVSATRMLDVTSGAPSQVGSTAWFNESTGAAIAAPNSGHIRPIGNPGLTNAELRGTPVSITGTQLSGIQTAVESLDASLPEQRSGGLPVVGFAAIPTATFTRPADTTPYASGDLVANSTTAGSVAPVQLTAARVNAGSFLINRVRMSKSGTAVANAQFRVHLFNVQPTVANGDNGVLLTSGRAGYIGRVDVDMTAANVFNDGAAAVADAGMLVALASGQAVWALIEARAAYTPASGETFALTLEVAQN